MGVLGRAGVALSAVGPLARRQLQDHVAVALGWPRAQAARASRERCSRPVVARELGRP